MNLKLLCAAAEIDCPDAIGAMEIFSIETDSRRVRVGSLFICIRGLQVDGHTFLQDAIAAGAACVLVEADAEINSDCPIPILRTSNTRRAAAFLYHAWYGYPAQKLKVIGVTGTNGKTSVTHMLRAILEASFFGCGLIGTVGCESNGRHLESRSQNALANMTTPDPDVLYRLLAEMVQDGVEYLLIEVTSHALALEKLAPIQFKAAIFTNLTPEHLDFHGSMEAYAAAKATLFEKTELAVINRDSPYADRMCGRGAKREIGCSLIGNADYAADHISSHADGVDYRLRSKSLDLRINCPIPGEFSVINSMQAAVCARELGVATSVIQDALASLAGVRGRMERVKLGLCADFRVLIDYAHTPDALENLLRSAAGMRRGGGRIVLVFGCGGERDRGKRPIMGRIASQNADFVIVTSDNSRGENPYAIIREICEGIHDFEHVLVISDRAEAIRQAILQAKPEDLILLAGKGHEEYEIGEMGRRPFCEKEIVRAAFEERMRTKEL